MRIVKMLVLTLSLAGLAGCHHFHGHPHNGDFCPPGQAKKGNC